MPTHRRYTLPDGTEVFENAQFEHGGFTYPAQWLACASDDDLAEHGIALALVAVPGATAEPLPALEVTDLQARLALEHIGRLHDVETLVEATGGAVAIWWDRSLTIRRDSPYIAQLAPVLGLTDADLDALFVDAASR